jgi:Bacterial Ig-like domain (group 3)/FG-GAP-like repeat
MRTHTQQMTRKPVPRIQAHGGVSPFIATLTILIALVALAPLSVIGQRQSSHPGNRLQTKGSVSGSSQPSSPLFLPAVNYPSGGRFAASVAGADVNGDSKFDLVVANANSNTVGVMLGNGDGHFQPPVIYGSGGRVPESVVVADVNGDGKPDLVAADACGSTTCASGVVGVLLGNGDGTFQAAVSYESGGIEAVSVAVADVNVDGRLDIVVANESNNTLGVLLGNGDGTFQAAVAYGSGSHSFTYSVVIADVNGDGKPDLVVADECVDHPTCNSGAVGVLLGNGDGTFQAAVIYPSGGVGSLSGARSVAVADVNGDGRPDVLVGNSFSGTVGVLLGNGDGTFQAPVEYNVGFTPVRSVAVADVNGDGRPDLLVGGDIYIGTVQHGEVGYLLGNGDGTFQPVVTFGSGGNAAFSIALADVNGDGQPDLLAANAEHNTVGVLLHSPASRSTTKTTLRSSLNPSTYGQAVTWTATVTSSGSITPTGKVKFTWSGYTIGSATLNSSGVAILTKSNLNADTYPLTAVYVGDANNLGSTSAVLNQVVLQTTTSATLTSSPNPSAQGQAVTFTATISSPTVVPTGPVTFTAGKTVLGTAQLSGRKAKFTSSTLAVGSTKVTATYYGNSNIAKSSASVTQTVR